MSAATPPGAAPVRPRGVVRRVVRIFVHTVVVLVVSQVVLAIVVVISHQRGDRAPPEPLVRQALAAGGLEPFEVRLEDDLVLRGELLGDVARRPVVVFGHGFRHTRRQGDRLAADLLAAGYAVVLFDFRGSGASDGVFSGAGAIEAPDVRAILRHLFQTRGVRPERCAFVGFSMGAAAALQAADALVPLAAAVLVAPYARLEGTYERRTRRVAGLPLRPWFTPSLWVVEALLAVDVRDVNPIEHAAELGEVPLLVLGAADDWRVPPDELAALAGAAPRAELLVLEDGDHFDIARFDEEVRRPIVEYLRRHLPAADGP